jgi:allophanate hydrolase subunit 2
LESLSSHAWEVTTDCDRTGTRFRRADGEEDMLTGGTLSALLGSQATVTGAIQLPPDGRPLLLGPDHGTVGGYEVVAVLRRSDLTMAGQLAAGTVVEFSDSPVAGEPVEALARRAVSGWLLPEPGVLP